VNHRKLRADRFDRSCFDDSLTFRLSGKSKASLVRIAKLMGRPVGDLMRAAVVSVVASGRLFLSAGDERIERHKDNDLIP